MACTDTQATAYIREARQGARMDWPVTSHTFGKTAATIWHDPGLLTDRQKADLTGHAKISTLTDIYVARGELHPKEPQSWTRPGSTPEPARGESAALPDSTICDPAGQGSPCR